MVPGVPHYANDSESLQADVMRFMAIIAFCLIAILALVRNVEPTETEVSVEQIPSTDNDPEPGIESDFEPEIEPEPTPVIEPEPPLTALAQVEPETILAPMPAPEFEPPAEPVVTVQPPPAPVVPTPPRKTTTPEAPPADPEPEAEEEGLILRFASDGDFLRLIARGDIKVYAYMDRDILGLDDSYRFLDSQAPGQVYELFTASIPNLIVDALKAERADVTGYRWGIALPQRISAQIERFLGEVTSGQLVIDRFGDVHHVAAS